MSGRRNGISASEAGSAPTSSSATPQPSERAQSASEAAGERGFEGAVLTEPVELGEAAGGPGGAEQPGGEPHRAVLRTAGEGLEGERLARAQIDDRLELWGDGPLGEQAVEFGDQVRRRRELHPVPIDRGFLPLKRLIFSLRRS
jgi:hypothetical protein